MHAAEPPAAREALRRYALRVAKARRSSASQAFPAAAETESEDFCDGLFPLFTAIAPRARIPPRDASVDADDEAEDSDGEAVVVCKRCQLPLGAVAFEDGDAEGGDRSGTGIHRECAAQQLVRELQAGEARRKEQELEVKRERRGLFDIGWDAGAAPWGASAQVAGAGAPRGMCCLELQAGANGADASISVRPTAEPAGAVNLEYLAISLCVRRLEGREPTFSLDPMVSAAATAEADGAMQVKRFEPEWLAGTSLGDVLFQADYHLKELSTGEFSQPVLGMHDCFHYADHGVGPQVWNAREWFFIRKAELYVSEDNVLIPCVKMGVQAREQHATPMGIEDAPMTSPMHPLVRYAEAFTRNFDLIAERRSVVYHLREVAKASVLAKFILETGADLSADGLLAMAEEAVGEAIACGRCCCMEVPQLWNDRLRSEIHLHDDLVERRPAGAGGDRRLYGGVHFGVDRFALAAPRKLPSSVLERAPMAVGATMVAAAQPILRRGAAGGPSIRRAGPRRLVPQQVVAARMGPSADLVAMSQEGQLLARRPVPPETLAGLSAPVVAARSASLLAGSAAMLPPGRLAGPLSQGLSLVPPRGEELHGVDLSLDGFNLSEPVGTLPTVAGALDDGDDRAGDEEASQTYGEAFWSALRGAGEPGAFAGEDLALFRRIFDDRLSDRFAEGRGFAPPVTSPSTYLSELDRLVKEEQSVRRRRLMHFFNARFSEADPGPLFPQAWKPSHHLSSSEAAASVLPSARTPLPREEWPRAVRRAVEEGECVFEQRAEDGAVFRIYRSSCVEARTYDSGDVWGLSGERVGAVYGVGEEARLKPQDVPVDEALQRATQFVEVASRDDGGALRCRCYVVLETCGGHRIATEKLADGTVTWEEDPPTLAYRNSRAKVLRSADCGGALITVLDLRRLHFMESRLDQTAGCATASERRHYADVAFCRAAGSAYQISSGLQRWSHKAPTADRGGKWKRLLQRRARRQGDAAEGHVRNAEAARQSDAPAARLGDGADLHVAVVGNIARDSQSRRSLSASPR